MKPQSAEFDQACFRQMAESIREVFWVATPDSRQILYVSPAYEQVWGRSCASLYQEPQSWLNAIHPEDRERAVAELAKLGDGATHEREYRVVRLDGSVRWILLRSFPVCGEDGNVIRITGVVEDITERKQIEQKQERLAHDLRLLLEFAGEGIYGLDTNGHCTFVNSAAVEMLGYEAAELIGRNMHDAIHHTRSDGSPYPERECQIFNAFRRGRDCRVDSEVLWRKDGTSFPAEYSSHPILVGGKIKGAVVTFIDITGRRKAEELLHEAEEKYRTLVEQLPAITYIAEFGHNGPWLYVSPQVEQLLGFPPQEWLGPRGHWLQQLHEDDRERVIMEEERHHTMGGPFTCEYRMRARDGRVVWFSDRAVFRRDQGGQPRYLQGVMLDITEYKQVEQRFVQAQKMEAIGRLAGGVAHDFNNILTAITGYTELILRDLVGDHPSRHNAEEVERAAYRAARLTRQLLAFSRRQVLQPRALDLNVVVGEMVKMLQRLVGEDISLCVSLADDLGCVHADPGQIEQVIMNLAVNSRDAMPNGGTLTIQTANFTYNRETMVGQMELGAGKYVMMAVTDTGIGMTAEVRARAFEPFFTTKPLGKGTGLGLATCYGIVKQSGGHMIVYSEPGHGTTFKIYLPQVNEPAGPPQKLQSSSVVPRGTETVLLVEDDRTVMWLAAFLLRDLGYTVYEASNGEEALRVFQQLGSRQVHLVVTDLVMPQMGGRQLVDHLKTESPGIKVLFTSGYTEDAIVHHGLVGPDVAFLQKPYTPGALARKVREELDHPRFVPRS